MLPKVFLEKTVFVNFKISNNFEPNIDETNLKNPYQPMNFKNLKTKFHKLKVSRLLPNLCNFHTKIHTLGNGFKNLKKIFRLANWIFILCDFHLLSERQSPTK